MLFLKKYVHIFSLSKFVKWCVRAAISWAIQLWKTEAGLGALMLRPKLWPLQKGVSAAVHIESLRHAMTLATPQTHGSQPLYQLALSAPRLFSLWMPFNLPALVYIVCVTIGVLLAAIMKGSISICFFLSLLLLQATAGKKHFGQISGGSLTFYERWCTVVTRYFCILALLMNEMVAWYKFRYWLNEYAVAVLDCSVGWIIQWQLSFRSCCSVVIQTVKMIRNKPIAESLTRF